MNTVNFIGTGQVITKIECLSASTITWAKTSGNLIFTPWNITNVLFNMTSGGSIGFTVTARNGSNQIIQTKNISFYNLGGFSVYPNPSSEIINLELPNELDFEVELVYLKNENSFQYSLASGKEKTININTLPRGDYLLKILFEGKVIHEKRILIGK